MRQKDGTGGGQTAVPLVLLSRISFFVFLFGHFATAAELPNVYALVNARVVTAPGKAIEKGTVVVRAGVVEAVGASAPSRSRPTPR